MKKIYIVIIIIVICVLIALIYRLDNKHNKLSNYNFVKDSISNEKQWNEKDINEQFIELEYNNSIYLSSDMKINADDIKKKIDTTNIIGHESFESIHKEQITLYSIKDISVNCAVAVKFENDENYYMYANPAYEDNSNKDTTIFRYDKNTNTTITVETSTTSEDSFSSSFEPIK